MTQVHDSLARAWGEVTRDIVLTGLRAELDGLTAMFSALYAPGPLPPQAASGAEEDEDLVLDNLPV
ncbi:hypothetical protein [Stagnihabitans tardus]|uniref:Uncharacterized protein n=1 Tax=Stagnihabitans tardus TaxID=2699202 RepID=A0AAE5BTW5_9RHOB|nr:hypothetical protein [Stagnihabitans tardus]NBZ86149.1 hypothetical protein [Stagnihabitans tardus]